MGVGSEINDMLNEFIDDVWDEAIPNKSESQLITKAGAKVYARELKSVMMEAHGRGKNPNGELNYTPLVDTITFDNNGDFRSDSASSFIKVGEGKGNLVYWLEYGTKRGIAPYGSMATTDSLSEGPVSRAMEEEYNRIIGDKG